MQPAWIVGLACLFYAHVRTWQWRSADVPGRTNALVLAVACAAWGWFTKQPTFAAVGGLGLVAWTYAVVFEILPDEFSGVWRLLIPGAFTMALAIIAKAHWSFLAGLLSGAF